MTIPPDVDVLICVSCNAARPPAEFGRNMVICRSCNGLTPNEVAKLTAASERARQHFMGDGRAARKAARQAHRMDAYAANGKRCTHCHVYKPVDAFNKCGPMADGLQPGCRSCNAIMTSIKLQPGQGIPAWHRVRDALRAATAAKELLRK